MLKLYSITAAPSVESRSRNFIALFKQLATCRAGENTARMVNNLVLNEEACRSAIFPGSGRYMLNVIVKEVRKNEEEAHHLIL